jgi:hypothetical protein
MRDDDEDEIDIEIDEIITKISSASPSSYTGHCCR